jgi:hypothetical protein
MLNPYTSNLGMADPLKKVYVTCQPINHLGLLLFACLATNVKYFYFIFRFHQWIMIKT